MLRAMTKTQMTKVSGGDVCVETMATGLWAMSLGQVEIAAACFAAWYLAGCNQS